MGMTRREFIKMSAAAAATLSLSGSCAKVYEKNGIPYRVLGKTGEKVSLLCVGGYNIGFADKLSDQESITLMRTAVDEGINFFDNAWEYHDGVSEERMGRALQDGYRQRVFLMTKHHGREPGTARKHLEDSLRRLKTDVIDLWQFHEIDEDGEIDSIYSSGALDVAVKAQEEGKIRYIGFTGHYRPRMHLEMINRGFAWDTVQMPVNVLDYHFRSFTNEVLPVAVEKNMGVIAMKSLAGTPGNIVTNGIARADECLRFVMTMPVSTVCSGMDSLEVLHKNIATARNFEPMTETEIAALLEKTSEYAAGAKYERYKTFVKKPGKVLVYDDDVS
jgi:predicted aldo/keto reductase-like oxidoreductase